MTVTLPTTDAEPGAVHRAGLEAKVWIGVFPLGQFWRVCCNEGPKHAHASGAAALADANAEALRFVGEGMAIEVLVQGTFRFWRQILAGQPKTTRARHRDLAKHDGALTPTRVEP